MGRNFQHDDKEKNNNKTQENCRFKLYCTKHYKEFYLKDLDEEIGI